MKKKICFIGLDNYPVINPKYGSYYFGGESVQQTLLAKAFAGLGFEASMICMDYGQADKEVFDGVIVYKVFKETAGLPVLRFFWPRITSVWAALKRADADIYYQSCAGIWTGIVACFCKVHNKKMIFRLAHDTDCIPGEQLIRFWRDRKIYEYGLRNTHWVAAQSRHQQALLKKNYNINSTIINMIVEIPRLNPERSQDIDVLWVNNFRTFKRPEKVLELAKLCPELSITMIGGAVPGNEEMFMKLKGQSENIANLTFEGPVSYHKVNDYFLRSKLFINTSDSEGFPNSFLQAFARKIPVITFFDPDGVIEAKQMGKRCSDLNNMAETIKSLILNDSERERIGTNGYKYVNECYGPQKIIQNYSRMMSNA
ncbi:glycosyltransferase family 4 protein [uncultured Desulfobacter sp.]|uniref:glycosyltransferase family 4 protein n=1 Tax=uncultured Desulfobacter sp. TaxID=240139 RepID=UPI002AA5F91F|nr:glycosyltransferase family 4 protein [uncultured Desulfobacter sp.]